MNIKQSDINRFFKYTKENTNGCIEWTGNKIRSGYGHFWFNGKNIGAHRFSWIMHYGEIAKNLCVCHSCDNPKCVNWKHLWLGTHQHNAKDRCLKNRNRKRKLTPEQENDIAIRFYTTDTIQIELAKEYNVTRGLINRTIRFKHFRDKYGKKTIQRYRKINPEIKKQIIEMKKAGKSNQFLAKLFNVSRKVIIYHLKN